MPASHVTVRSSARKTNALSKYKGPMKELEANLKEQGIKVAPASKAQLSRYKIKFKNLERKIGGATDTTSMAINKTLLKTLLSMDVSLLPMAEEQYLTYRTDKNLYALIALGTQIRELSVDLKAQTETTALIAQIQSSVLEPSMALVLQQIISHLNTFKREMAKNLDAKTAKTMNRQMDAVIRNCGKYIKDTSSSMSARLHTTIGEPTK